MKHEIHKATPEEHRLAIEVMREFLEDTTMPQAGLFWLNPKAMSLFGVRKALCPSCPVDETIMLDWGKMQDYWDTQHLLAIERHDIRSPFYDVDNYKKMPRGAIVCMNGEFVAIVGNWIKDVNKTKLTELLEDEFNLMVNSLDYRSWRQLNIGSDWPSSSGTIENLLTKRL